jgi:SAM-dependent methyltransferase
MTGRPVRRLDRVPDPLPLPPLEMRRLVGPTADTDYDNPAGDLVFPQLEARTYESVLDWGCGCGRIARRLIQQSPRPHRYLGLDLHLGMIRWCQQNLAPRAPGFEFRHHDVFDLGFNPASSTRWLPFPADDDSFTLAIAWSVFTHVNEEHAVRYLHEMARVLRPDGVLMSTWFLFDKREFPMMQPHQNALFINDVHPENAVIFDRNWFVEAARHAGFVVTWVGTPTMRGYHWYVALRPPVEGVVAVTLPEDAAPYGTWDAPPPTAGLDRIGRDRRASSGH